MLDRWISAIQALLMFFHPLSLVLIGICAVLYFYISCICTNSVSTTRTSTMKTKIRLHIYQSLRSLVEHRDFCVYRLIFWFMCLSANSFCAPTETVREETIKNPFQSDWSAPVEKTHTVIAVRSRAPQGNFFYLYLNFFCLFRLEYTHREAKVI